MYYVFKYNCVHKVLFVADQKYTNGKSQTIFMSVKNEISTKLGISTTFYNTVLVIRWLFNRYYS